MPNQSIDKIKNGKNVIPESFLFSLIITCGIEKKINILRFCVLDFEFTNSRLFEHVEMECKKNILQENHYTSRSTFVHFYTNI